MLSKLISHDPAGFRWRGGEVSRLEGLSDAIFAISITLLVVSLEVPATYGDLSKMMSGFLAFGLSFSLLMYIWYCHYIYFRRYGLQDTITITLNATILFLILFYIYPLKFLSNFLIATFVYQSWDVVTKSGEILPMIKPGETAELMTIYSLGYVLVFLVFFLMQSRALKFAGKLELNPKEILITKAWLCSHGIMIGLGLTSAILAFFFNLSGLAGFVYASTGIFQGFNGYFWGKRVHKLAALSEKE
ncbi:MAG: DUF1211 domain-containing protein [Bacteroidetes bacterium]|nr:DUF1211 domain-containing protein [Bacteroidota bacterium]